MARATSQTGVLQFIDDCGILIPGARLIKCRILPEISDSKGASYNDEPVMGRSSPIKTFSHSDNKTLSVKWHFIVTRPADVESNLLDKRALESAAYPRQGSPYRPPPVCLIKCGRVLGDSPLCVILRNYSANYPTNVSWDNRTLLPYYFTMDLAWDVVYASTDLPGQERIAQIGR